MFGRRRKRDNLETKVDELIRIVRLQGEAHSTIMNQQADMYADMREGFKEVHNRISFTNRPRP
ncbi:hypothetical protein A6A22_10810 [Arthrobacter sp. OY3WO11]|nr:hypothetical protein A6A22_10810 [Arthrobacter sp. OY3WO11]